MRPGPKPRPRGHKTANAESHPWKSPHHLRGLNSPYSNQAVGAIDQPDDFLAELGTALGDHIPLDPFGWGT